ncbi:MAG: hypothetical protein IKE90_02380 [Bacilli bacterium]|nr:hypothetical protein [Bacilli bacterium]
MEDIFNVKINVLENVDLDIIYMIQEKIKNNISVTDQEINYFLNYLCFEVRKKLSLKKSKEVKDNLFTNQCDTAQSMIYYYLNELGVLTIPVNTNDVLGPVTGHSFVLAFINGEYYLIDPTYNQFFDLKKCFKDNFVVIKGKVSIAPAPGYFVSMYSLEDKKKIIDFLKNGFMKVSSDNLRLYGDSFYKTKTGVNMDFSETASIPSSHYLKWFLNSNSKLSKTVEDLEEENLLIKPLNTKNNVKKV